MWSSSVITINCDKSNPDKKGRRDRKEYSNVNQCLEEAYHKTRVLAKINEFLENNKDFLSSQTGHRFKVELEFCTMKIEGRKQERIVDSVLSNDVRFYHQDTPAMKQTKVDSIFATLKEKMRQVVEVSCPHQQSLLASSVTVNPYVYEDEYLHLRINE